MGIVVLFAILFVGMLVGLPIFLTIGVATLAYMIDVGPNVLPIFMQRLFSGTLGYSFAAVPLFILAGSVMSKTGITDRIIRLCNGFVGHWRGGLAQVNIAASVVFAGISGSALADTAALGSILIPAMEKEGYERAYAAAVTSASATLGPIIPPSIIMVIYGSAFGMSVGALFAAGVVPGLILAISQFVVTYILARRHGYPRQPRSSLVEIWRSVLAAWTAIIMPFIILGGIFSGTFTANEASGIAVLYALLLGLLLYRNINLKTIYGLFKDVALQTAAILFILAVAQNFAWIVSRRRIPIVLMNAMLGLTTNPTLLLILIGITLFIAGMFVERAVNLFLLGPILLPILTTTLGMDALHAGMFMIFVLGIGHVTPPFGAALYTVAMISDTDVEKIVKFLWPYIAGMVVVALLIMFVEPVVMWLPRLLGLR